MVLQGPKLRLESDQEARRPLPPSLHGTSVCRPSIPKCRSHSASPVHSRKASRRVAVARSVSCLLLEHRCSHSCPCAKSGQRKRTNAYRDSSLGDSYQCCDGVGVPEPEIDCIGFLLQGYARKRYVFWHVGKEDGVFVSKIVVLCEVSVTRIVTLISLHHDSGILWPLYRALSFCFTC